MSKFWPPSTKRFRRLDNRNRVRYKGTINDAVTTEGKDIKMALGPTAIVNWLKAAEAKVNMWRAAHGLKEVKLRFREYDGNAGRLYSTLGTRTVMCGVVDYVAHTVTERQNGPIGSSDFAVIMLDVNAKLAA